MAVALALRAGDAVEQQRQLDVLGRAEHRDEVEGLEDEAHRPGPVAGPAGVGHGEQVLALDQHPAAVDVVQPGQAVQQRGLARAARAHHRDQLAAPHHQVEAGQGLDLDAAGPVHLAHLLGHQQGLDLAVLVHRWLLELRGRLEEPAWRVAGPATIRDAPGRSPS